MSPIRFNSRGAALGLVATLLALLALPCGAEVYRWVDKDGRVSYSDTPPPQGAANVKQQSYSDNVTPSTDMPYAVKVATEKSPVVLYANACGEPCANARALLRNRGIPFTDRDPERDGAAMDALKAATGGTSVPVLMVGAKPLKGFAEQEWMDALTSAGYPRSNPGIRPRAPAPAPAPAATSATPPATPGAAPAK